MNWNPLGFVIGCATTLASAGIPHMLGKNPSTKILQKHTHDIVTPMFNTAVYSALNFSGCIYGSQLMGCYINAITPWPHPDQKHAPTIVLLSTVAGALLAYGTNEVAQNILMNLYGMDPSVIARVSADVLTCAVSCSMTAAVSAGLKNVVTKQREEASLARN